MAKNTYVTAIVMIVFRSSFEFEIFVYRQVLFPSSNMGVEDMKRIKETFEGMGTKLWVIYNTFESFETVFPFFGPSCNQYCKAL